MTRGRVLSLWIGAAAAVLLLVAAASMLASRDGRRDRREVVTATGGPETVLMDFSTPFPLDPLPPGWYHRTFWTRAPLTYRFAETDGVRAMRFETNSSASMLFRHVDIDLGAYPMLAWRWYIEEPIASTVDERRREGDDHPARLFLAFLTERGEERSMEIVWGNKILEGGDYKYIRGFPHYVADGGDDHIRQWRDETVDLQAIYASLWHDAAPARLVDIAVFCDSDDTKGHTVAYVAWVKMLRAAP